MTIAALWLVLGGGWQGQTTEPVDTIVARLVEQADRYRARLPSLECDEAIVSEELKRGAVKKSVTVQGVFRVVRSGPAQDPFVESHRFNLVDGRPAPAHFGFPFFLQGAFANGVGYSPATLGCYRHAVEKNADPAHIVVVSTRTEAADAVAGCEDTILGFVRRTVVDRASGTIVRVEVHTPTEMARRKKRPFFAEIDYAPVVIGGETYSLPVRVATHDELDERRFEVRYTNFHRFGATVTILPGATKVDSP